MRVLVALLAACGGNPAAPDATPADQPPADAALGQFGAPVPLIELNTADSEEDPSLPADELEIFFVSNRAGGAGLTDVWTATRASTSTPFGVPTPVTQINTAEGEFHPQVSPDGLSMYLSSNRVGSAGADIYFTTRASRSAPWATPTRVVELSSPSADFAVAPDSSGLNLVLGSNRTGGIDLFVSSRTTITAAWRGPAAIGNLNTAADEQDGVLAAEGRALYFTRGGDAALLKEIFVARRPTVDSAFGEATPVTEVSSAMDELDPWVSDDERTIYFTSNRGANDDLFVSVR